MKEVLVVSLASISIAACAADYPAPVQALVEQGVEVHARFDAPGGLTGYAARIQGQPLTLYLTADGKQVIVGNMLDGQGNDLSAAQLERHLPEPDFDSAWPLLEKSTWIAEGGSDPKRMVYVFDDPNCPYCKALWEASQSYLDEDVQVRHIMVAVIHPSSIGKAARLLTADDRRKAFADHQRDGSEPLDTIPQPVREQIETNNRLMRQLGAHGTPAVFYKDPQGKVRRIIGLPTAESLTDEIFQKKPR